MKYFLLILSLFFTIHANSSCLENDEYVELSGRLIAKEFPNPLAENDNPEENKPYVRRVLVLSETLECVYGVDNESFPNWNKEVQLLHTNTVSDNQLEALENENVTLAGRLSLAAGAPFEFTAVELYVEKASLVTPK